MNVLFELRFGNAAGDGRALGRRLCVTRWLRLRTALLVERVALGVGQLLLHVPLIAGSLGWRFDIGRKCRKKYHIAMRRQRQQQRRRQRRRQRRQHARDDDGAARQVGTCRNCFLCTETRYDKRGNPPASSPAIRVLPSTVYRRLQQRALQRYRLVSCTSPPGL